MSNLISNPSITNQILSIIKEDPGVSARDIHAFMEDVPMAKVSASLAYLRRSNQIQNRGKHARGASWYPKG